jgi:protein TonB
MKALALRKNHVDRAQSRRLAAASAVSILVHGLASVLVPPMRLDLAPTAPPLEVVLLPPPAPPAVEPEAKSPQPPVRSEGKPAARSEEARTPPPAQRARERRPAPKPPAAQQEEPRVAEEPAPEQIEPPASVAIARPPEMPVPTPPSTPPAAPSEPSSPELLADYGKTVSELLARHREYPRVALARGWEGSVMMRLRVAPGGRLVDAFVEKSSGYEVLDEQALAMLKRVPALPEPPEALRDREFAILVPVVFRLQR